MGADTWAVGRTGGAQEGLASAASIIPDSHKTYYGIYTERAISTGIPLPIRVCRRLHGGWRLAGNDPVDGFARRGAERFLVQQDRRRGERPGDASRVEGRIKPTVRVTPVRALGHPPA